MIFITTPPPDSNTGYIYRQTPVINIPTTGFYKLSAQGDNILGLYVDETFVLTYNYNYQNTPATSTIFLDAGNHTFTIDVVNTGPESTFSTNPGGMAVVLADNSNNIIWNTRLTTMLYTITGVYNFQFFQNGLSADGIVTVYDPVREDFYSADTTDGNFNLYDLPLNFNSIVTIQRTNTSLVASEWTCTMIKDGKIFNLGTGSQNISDGGDSVSWTTPSSYL